MHFVFLVDFNRLYYAQVRLKITFFRKGKFHHIFAFFNQLLYRQSIIFLTSSYLSQELGSKKYSLYWGLINPHNHQNIDQTHNKILQTDYLYHSGHPMIVCYHNISV